MKMLLNSAAVDYTEVSVVGRFLVNTRVAVSFQVILEPLAVFNIEGLVSIAREGNLGSYNFDGYGIVGVAPSGIYVCCSVLIHTCISYTVTK